MKKLFTILFSLLSTTVFSAYDFEVDGIYYDSCWYNDNEVSVTYKSWNNPTYSGSVLIPSTVTYNGITYSVKEIGGSAFEGCTGLTSITIPNSVTSIGYEAFYRCSGLTSVTIPNSVKRIGSDAFKGCTGLTSVTIPNSVKEIGSGAFEGCTGLTSVTIPNSVTEIGSSAFYGTGYYNNESNWENGVLYVGDCLVEVNSNKLSESYTIKEGTRLIANSAFDDCSSLTSITIPSSVTSIGNWAFARCSGLTSITIPNSVKRIGSDAFSGCSSLTSITIPNSVTSIGDYAFLGCSSLTSITIPNSVTSIEDGAFWGCSSLTSITIPNSVTSIGCEAFWGVRPNISYIDNCLVDLHDGLGRKTWPDVFVVQPGTRLIAYVMFCAYAPHTIVIPSSVKYMDYRVLSCGECYPIRDVYCSAATPPIFANIYTDCLEEFPITAYVPKQSLHLYQEAEGWKAFQLKPYHFDKSNLKKSAEIFYNPINSTDLELVSNKGKCPKQLEVPSFATLNDSIYTVTSIAQHAFMNQKSLRSITIPFTVHHIGKEAFCGTGIYANQKNWQEGVLYVDNCLIKANREISGEHIVPAGTHVIAEEAFDGCIWLGGVVLPESLTHINSAAFRGCKWLVKITSYSDIPPVLVDDVFEHVEVSRTKVYVPDYAVDDYKQAEGWKMFKHILPIPDDDSL